MDCWEHKKCGREAGGEKAQELGVCPAYTAQAGQACWLIAGTFCSGEVQGTFAQKENNCMRCDFFTQFDVFHRARMREKYAHLMVA